MPRIPTRALLFISLLLPLSINAALPFFQGPHDLYLGPEAYHLKREKEGGSHQSGWLYGGRVQYERRAPNRFYWAFVGRYAYGTIKGSTRSGKSLKSHLTDGEIEGLFGYTFCFKRLPNLQLTPYGGYGLFSSVNDFVSPSPLRCKYYDHFQYGVAGIDAFLKIRSCLSAGISFKAKYMVDGESTITKDPDYNNITLQMKNETQYDVELPIRYNTCWKNRKIKLDVAPFYRYRHFGGRVNYPFDFIDTEFNIYGARALVEICF